MISSQQTIPSSNAFEGSNSFLKTFLYCGVIATAWYILINILVPYWYPGYNIQTQTVSELSAIDTPTRTIWFILCLPYTLLMITFGLAVRLSSKDSWKLKLVGGVLIIDAVFGAYWPPMHRREVIAAGYGTLTDTLHVVWAYVHLVFILIAILFAASALKRSFRVYSIFTLVVFLVFGILTSMEAPALAKNEPTPNIGIWERVNMAAYMIWIAVFAVILVKKRSPFFRGDAEKD